MGKRTRKWRYFQSLWAITGEVAMGAVRQVRKADFFSTEEIWWSSAIRVQSKTVCPEVCWPYWYDVLPFQCSPPSIRTDPFRWGPRLPNASCSSAASHVCVFMTTATCTYENFPPASGLRVSLGTSVCSSTKKLQWSGVSQVFASTHDWQTIVHMTESSLQLLHLCVSCPLTTGAGASDDQPVSWVTSNVIKRALAPKHTYWESQWLGLFSQSQELKPVLPR